MVQLIRKKKLVAEEVIGFRGLKDSALREVLNGYSKKKPAPPSSSLATAFTSSNGDKQKLPS